MSSESLVAAATILAFGLIIMAAVFGSAVGDGILSSRAVEAIARQPEARPNITTFLFLGLGLVEAFPIIGLGLAFYLIFVLVPLGGLLSHLAK